MAYAWCSSNSEEERERLPFIASNEAISAGVNLCCSSQASATLGSPKGLPSKTGGPCVERPISGWALGEGGWRDAFTLDNRLRRVEVGGKMRPYSSSSPFLARVQKMRECSFSFYGCSTGLCLLERSLGCKTICLTSLTSFWSLGTFLGCLCNSQPL